MTGILTRTFELDRAAAKAGVFPAVATTEAPVDRGDYWEVLDMSRVDLSRAPLPFIESHDTKTVNVGICENVRTDGEKLRCDVRLGKSSRAQELASDIGAGIIRGLSIGYSVSDPIQQGENDGVPIMRFAFAPHEVSAVSVPADVNAGFYRTGNKIMGNENKQTRSERKRENRADESEQERIEAIRQIAEHFDLANLGMKAISEEWPLQRFNDEALKEVGKRSDEAYRPETANFGERNVQVPQISSFGRSVTPDSPWERMMGDYSVTRILRGLADPKELDGAGLEIEVSQEMQRMLGSNSKGIVMPFEALQQRAVTYAGDGSNIVSTDHLAGSFIDVLRNRSHVMNLNPTVLRGLEGNVAIPKKTGTTTPYWIAGDNSDSITESDPSLGQVTMSPKTVGGAATFSHRMIVQSSPDVESMVRRDLADMIAVELDNKAINGDGLSNTPLGVLSTTGINTKTFTATEPTFEELVSMETLIADDNADAPGMAYLTTPTLREHFKITPKQGSGVEGNFIWDNGRINTYRCLTTKNVPAGGVILADWSQLLVGFWGGITLDADPYGDNFLKGSITVRIMADIDLNVRQAEAFCSGSM